MLGRYLAAAMADATHSQVSNAAIALPPRDPHLYSRRVTDGRIRRSTCIRRYMRFLNVDSMAPWWHIIDILFADTMYACPKPSADSVTGQAA